MIFFLIIFYGFKVLNTIHYLSNTIPIYKRICNANKFIVFMNEKF